MSTPRKIDLHVHSTYSDGTVTPRGLLDLARERGVAVLAITDHDTVQGIRSLRGIEHPVRVIPGVELSAIEGQDTEVHVLGYYVDIQEPSFLERLASLAEARDRRGRGIVERINAAMALEGRPPLRFSSIREAAPDVVARPHIARYLVERGDVLSIEEAFVRYLIPWNLPKQRLRTREAVHLIHQAGGLAVLAHPARLQPPGGESLDSFVGRLVAVGLDGIEVYYSWYSREETEMLRRIAERWGLVMTGGSDFHGQNKLADLGVPPLAETLLESLEARWRRRFPDAGDPPVISSAPRNPLCRSPHRG